MDRFIARIVALRMHASVGWGTDYGSLISAEQLARTTAAVDDAVAKGADGRWPAAIRDPTSARSSTSRPS